MSDDYPLFGVAIHTLTDDELVDLLMNDESQEVQEVGMRMTELLEIIDNRTGEEA